MAGKQMADWSNFDKVRQKGISSNEMPFFLFARFLKDWAFFSII